VIIISYLLRPIVFEWILAQLAGGYTGPSSFINIQIEKQSYKHAYNPENMEVHSENLKNTTKEKQIHKLNKQAHKANSTYQCKHCQIQMMNSAKP